MNTADEKTRQVAQSGKIADTGDDIMENIGIPFSTIDHIVLNSYKVFVEGLSDYLGGSVEIVLHSLENLDQSVIKIINGQYTGRKEGAPITDLALSMLAKIKKTGTNPYITYFNRNKKGEPIKAATIAVMGERQRIIGLVCMNFYLNTPLFSVLAELTPHTFSVASRENFSDNIDEVIEQAVRQNQDSVNSNSKIPLNCKNKEIIALLLEQGIFNLKDAVITVANLLHISKNTVYMHVRNSGGR